MWLCEKKKEEEGGGVHVTAVSTLSGHEQPVVCFLSPVSASGNIWRRPKSANNAAIQRVAPSLSQETLRYGDLLKNGS